MNKKKRLNKHDLQVLRYLNHHFKVLEKKYAPSVREIGNKLNMSTSHVIACLDNLKDYGYIEREPIIARSISMTGKVYEKEEDNQTRISQ
jgi:DNA-binding MarR family transcriptional regulator